MLADTWIYKPKKDAWTERKPETHPKPRGNHYLVWADHLKALLLVGGSGPNGVASDAWVYETSENRWTQVRIAKWPASAGLGAGAYVPKAKLFLSYNLKSGKTWVLEVRQIK